MAESQRSLQPTDQSPPGAAAAPGAPGRQRGPVAPGAWRRRALWVASNLGLAGAVAWVAAIVDRTEFSPELATSLAAGAAIAVGVASLARALGHRQSRRLILVAVGLSLLAVVIRESLGYREFVRLAAMQNELRDRAGGAAGSLANERGATHAPAAADSQPANLLDYVWQSLDDREPIWTSRRLWRPLGAVTLALTAGLGAAIGQRSAAD